MVEIFGKFFYIDFDAITESCKTGNIVKDEEQNEVLEINIFKYEIIKMCIERILNEINEADEEMGFLSQHGASLSFKFAFNTLLMNNIIKEIDSNE